MIVGTKYHNPVGNGRRRPYLITCRKFPADTAVTRIQRIEVVVKGPNIDHTVVQHRGSKDAAVSFESPTKVVRIHVYSIHRRIVGAEKDRLLWSWRWISTP